MPFLQTAPTQLCPALSVALCISGCSLAFDVGELQDGAGGRPTTDATSPSSTGTGGEGTGGTGGGNSVYAQTVIDSGPLAFYRFDDESDPFRAKDLIAGQDGTYTGSGERSVMGAIPGDSSGAIHFDGNSRVELPNAFEFAGLATFTVEFWFRAQGVDTTQFIVSNDSGFSPMRFGYTTLIFGGGGVGIERWNGELVIGASMPMGTAVGGTWYHYVATFDGVRHQVYLDGIAGGTYNESLALVSDGKPALVGEGFVGDVDELAFYGRALTAAEALEHFSAK